MEKKFKANNISVKDIDSTKGIVQFYASQFGNIDSDLDVMVEGAFKKTIEENKKRLKHLKNHNPTQTPGVIKNIYEDGIGLLVESQLLNTTLGRDTLIEYSEGAITEHSIGFNVLRDEIDEGTGARRIKEVRLWEVSTLNAWGANENTPTLGVKNMLDVVEHMKKINTILTRTSISDERAEELLVEYKKLESFIKSLNPKEPEQSTPDAKSRQSTDDQSVNLLETFKQFRNER